MRLIKLLFITALLFSLPCFIYAEDFPEKSDKLVNDYSRIFNNVDNIEQKLVDFERNNQARMIIVVLPVKGDMNDYADQLFSQWNVGGREDKGILFLISSEKKEAALKLSYGLSENLKQEQIDDLVSNGINPALLEGNYTQAVDLGAKNLEKILKGEYNGVQSKSSNNLVFGVIFLFVVLFIIIASAYGRQERRRIIYNKEK
ncbi:MAG: TPM domain-containing protein [Patescibacteria group bacterium]|jgi:uncharacterized protein